MMIMINTAKVIGNANNTGSVRRMNAVGIVIIFTISAYNHPSFFKGFRYIHAMKTRTKPSPTPMRPIGLRKIVPYKENSMRNTP